MTITTADIGHEGAFGDLRILTIQMALPIGDKISKEYVLDGLQDYIDALIEDKVGQHAHETFVADNGVVMHINHSYPAVDYLEALTQEKNQP